MSIRVIRVKTSRGILIAISYRRRGWMKIMRKRILLAGLVLMSMGLPLCAEVSRSGGFTLNDSPTTVHLQIVNSMITGTGRLSFLDTRPQPSLVNAGHSVICISTPAFQTSKPVVPVPEPTHYALMGLGIVGLFLARLDRRNATK